MGGLLQPVFRRDLQPLGNVRLRCGFGLRFCARRVAASGDFAAFGPAAVGWSASMARSEPALTALAGAEAGLAMAVAAVLAERRPSAGAAGVSAGVSAGLVAGIGAGVGADQGGSADAMSWRPPSMARWHLGRLARAQQPWLRRRCQVRP